MNVRQSATLLIGMAVLAMAVVGGWGVGNATTPLTAEGQIVVQPLVNEQGLIEMIKVGFRPTDGRGSFGSTHDQPAGFFYASQLVGHAGTWLQSGHVQIRTWTGFAVEGRILVRPEIDENRHLSRIEFGFRPSWGINVPKSLRGPDDIFPTKRFITRELAQRSTGSWLRSSRTVIVVPLGCQGAIGALGCEFVDVSAGANHSCAVHTSGSVTCWSSNEFRQARSPVGSFTSVSAGGTHTCGRRTSGYLQCWGSNEDGQTDAPVEIFRTVSAGASHSCGVHDTGAVKCWGSNTYSQIDAPEGDFVSVSAGGGHSCGVRESGEVQCWGSDVAGQLRNPPGQFRLVSAGWLHTCGLLETGEVRCWGANAAGESDPPEGRFRTISAGAVFTCGVRETGTNVCWGWDDQGQGNVPWTQFDYINAGGSHACGASRYGFSFDRSIEIECWGSDDAGQATVPGSESPRRP